MAPGYSPSSYGVEAARVPMAFRAPLAASLSPVLLAVDEFKKADAGSALRRLFQTHRRAASLPALRRRLVRTSRRISHLFCTVSVGAKTVHQSLPDQLVSQSLADRSRSHLHPLVNVRFAEKHHAREDFQIAGNFFQKRARENAC